MFFTHEHFACFGKDRVGQTAQLGAGAAIGASAVGGKACIALTGIGHTKGAVDEMFDTGIFERSITGTNRLKRQFTGEHDLRKTERL